MNWLEVSLTVDGELAEAVADVMARFAPNGVVIERGVGFVDADDPGTPLPEVSVRTYLPADESLEETRRRLEEALWYLGRIQPLPAPTFTPITDENWMESWKQHYRPIPVGESLIIVPAWMESPDAARTPIRIDPGMAFGTGTHPTTQLALELLEKHVPAGGDVIDVGCGSGILSVAALKLGAARALGVDIDEAALQSARGNASVNGVGDELILARGSVDEILAGGGFPFRQAPLVLANILAPILIRLMEAGLTSLVAPGGVLILSGILDEQEEHVREAARTHRLQVIERRQMGDWVAFALKG
ncbi:MAG: 50S ribosomal protein L11 methyltransferase [Chloroflexi bacterium]|nr:50S ribosomal protein L11 methyltransferase [Chloroflexota bacterium]